VALGGDGALVAWRLDRSRHAARWDSGEGAWQEGGRWNSVGRRAVYCSLDPATTILEKAVHAGFASLDVVPHVLTSLTVKNANAVTVVKPEDIPDPAWLAPGVVSAGQQAFGDGLLARHDFIVVPSVVSAHSWNLVFDPARAAKRYVLRMQEPFVLDGRLATGRTRHPR
jgi:RES domain-containing protein